jgi:uncharacterized membrane protein (TIGR02234 family)
MDPMPAQKPARPGSREKVLAALLAAVGAGLVLASAGRSWAHGTLTAPVRLPVSANGSDLTGVPFALGLAALAGAVALFAVRRIGRYAVGAILLAAGVGAVVAVAGRLSHLDSALLAKAAAEAAAADARIIDVGNSAWPYLTIAGGVLIALSGAYTLLRGGTWSGLSNRYERTVPATSAAVATPAPVSSAAVGAENTASATPDGELTSRDLWDALNRGADPTV